jgi:signal transduction histidine kinase
VETVAQALKLPYVAIALKQGEVHVVGATYGVRVDDVLTLPLSYGAETLGELSLGLRAGEAAFSAADRRLLEDLARQAGVVAYAVRLTADLQRSRERLVTTREEERLRLRRDLHDGLGPALGAFILKLGAARNMLPSDQAAADALLAGLIEDVGDAVDDIRRLVYNLRPPSLDELGLVGAIYANTARYDVRGGVMVCRFVWTRTMCRACRPQWR